MPKARRILVALLATASFLALPSSATAKQKMPTDYPAWSWVAHCESGGWQVLGSAYPDPFGISKVNWKNAGGSPMPPGPVAPSQRPAAIRIADRFRHQYHAPIPDPYPRCHAW